MKVRVRDPGDLAPLLRDEVGPIKSITSTRSTIVLETIKETYRLPLVPQGPGNGKRRTSRA